MKKYAVVLTISVEAESQEDLNTRVEEILHDVREVLELSPEEVTLETVEEM